MPARSDRRAGRGRCVVVGAAVCAVLLPLACSAEPEVVAGTPAVTSSPPARPIRAEVLPESAPLRVQIPAIGVATGELVQLGLTAQRALEVPVDAVTAGWFKLSPTPGEIGPSVIAGHVNYGSVPGVFAKLHEMKPGDTITVDRADGTSAEFTAYAVERFPKAAFPTERVYGNTESPELRLITCGGGFNEAAGEYLDNVIVFAKLTNAYQH